MKTITLSTTLLLAITISTTAVYAQEQTLQITPVVQAAVIYLDGAELSQTKQISLNPGRTQIVFNGISSKIISKSVQVTASGDANILSINDKLNYINSVENTPRTKGLRDSVKLLNENITLLNMDRDVYENERVMLDKNQAIGGQDKGVAIAELKLAADFYRSRMKDINNELYKIDKKTEQYNETLLKLNQQIQELNGAPKGPTAEITVLVSSAIKQTINLDLKYLVSDAGWAPSYDIITEDVNKPINLKYRAKVYNNTNVDWKNIKVKLSTGDPMKNASKPELEDWYLNFEEAINYNNRGAKGEVSYSKRKAAAPSVLSQQNMSNTAPAPAMYQEAVSANYDKKDYNQGQQQVQKNQVSMEEIEVSDLSAEFDIKTEYTIPSDAKPYIIDVTAYDLPATYKYISIPKADKSAFMLAQITGWEKLELVSGPANVYLGGTYVGQSYIDTKSTNDTLDLSVGRDNKIAVSRIQLKDYNTEKIIGNNKKTTFAYEITVKNTRKGPITIDIEDQVPVSQSSDITVDQLDVSKGEVEPLTGKVKWTMVLGANETKKLNLSYSIKYPRNKTLKIKKYRTISCPSF
jgi:uncharacterized protein (TIGR02231 family)